MELLFEAAHFGRGGRERDRDRLPKSAAACYSGSRSYGTARHLSRVVAGLVPATSILLAPCANAGGRRDKPGDDGGICDSKQWKSAVARVLTGQDLDGRWVIVQDGVYRYALTQVGSVLVRSVIFEYLATEVYWDEDAPSPT